MAIPKALQAQVEEAERIHKSVYGKPTPDTEPEKPSGEEPKQETQPTDSAAPDETNAEATPPEQQGEEERGKKRKPFEKDDAESWKARYFSFQGNHRQIVADLQRQIDDLKNQLADKPAATPEPQPTTKPQKRVTEKDVEAFGSDLIDVIDRKAQEVAESVISALQERHEKELSSLKSELKEAKAQLGNVAQTQANTAEERFYDALSTGVGDWETVQATDECQEWLGSKVPGTSFTWDDVLKDAAGKFDGSRAVEVFEEFFKVYPKLNPKRRETPRKESSDLQRQVAPPKSAAPVNPQSNGKRVYTSAEFEAESNRIIRLSKQGKHDEAAQIEAELNAAMSEGRIRP